MLSDIEKLFLLFEHPLEPSIFPRNEGKVCFDPPMEFRSDRLKQITTEKIIESRSVWSNVEEIIKIKSMEIPDLTFAFELKKSFSYSEFIPKHREIAGKLIKLLLDHENLNELLSVAVYCKDHVNPYIFIYALTVVLQHKPETRDELFPALFQMYPDQFFEPSSFLKMKEEWRYPEELRMRVDIPMDFTATNQEPEHLMAYFREDIGINMSHWHWHIVYPSSGPDEVVRKDRRGELFYYLHSQILARYNVERIAHQLPLTKPFDDYREPITEAYFPKLVRGSSGKSYTPRMENSILQDLKRADVSVDIADLERWRDRIVGAIDAGFIIDENGNQISLDDENGVDILGNLIESSSISINPDYYGDLHNLGHSAIAYIHDPDGRHLEDVSIMGTLQTSMRDPVFYRWHDHINIMFNRFKLKLPEYTRQELENEHVILSSIEVKMNLKNAPSNLLVTYWQKSEVDLGSGLDFGPGNVQVAFTHLQHVPFTYKIGIVNLIDDFIQGTCRIFCCPQMPGNFRSERNLMIEMDKFSVNLVPGQNIIERQSIQSSVTIPYERTFKRVDQVTDRFCGCGWPNHVLLPKGTTDKMRFYMFVMISNYADDLVDGPMNQWDRCGDAHTFCGLRDRRYPDKRAMGFPFDRTIKANSLEEFVDDYDNMNVQEFEIMFRDVVIDRASELNVLL